MRTSSTEWTADVTSGVKLSVIVATYNGSAYIRRCLESFTAQSIAPSSFEVIVVDNNSKDMTAEIVRECMEQHKDTNFVFIQEARQGVGYARNTGIAGASGEYLCFIDDDAYADPHWLERVLHAFEKVEPAPAVVGGRILPYYIEEKPQWFTDDLEIRTMGDQARLLHEYECFFGFPESNFCVRKSILDEVGGFSIEMGPSAEIMKFGEGIELSARIAKKYPVYWYDPEVIVYHLVPASKMSIKYTLSRKYDMAYSFQQHQSRTLSGVRRMIVLSTCGIRVGINLLLSVVGVRWFTDYAVKDWLSHMLPLVRCYARCSCIMNAWFGRS